MAHRKWLKIILEKKSAAVPKQNQNKVITRPNFGREFIASPLSIMDLKLIMNLRIKKQFPMSFFCCLGKACVRK